MLSSGMSNCQHFFFPFQKKNLYTQFHYLFVQGLTHRWHRWPPLSQTTLWAAVSTKNVHCLFWFYNSRLPLEVVECLLVSCVNDCSGRWPPSILRIQFVANHLIIYIAGLVRTYTACPCVFLSFFFWIMFKRAFANYQLPGCQRSCYGPRPKQATDRLGSTFTYQTRIGIFAFTGSSTYQWLQSCKMLTAQASYL